MSVSGSQEAAENPTQSLCPTHQGGAPPVDQQSPNTAKPDKYQDDKVVWSYALMHLGTRYIRTRGNDKASPRLLFSPTGQTFRCVV